MSGERISADTLRHWEKLAQQANETFQDQPMEDVGGALAMLTAMMIAGLMQNEGPLTDDAFKGRVAWMIAQHGKLVYDMVPVFLEVVEGQAKKGKH